ncbi:MAG: EAL domain-containing protein [Nevskiaceae bacterium]|nr:MAG: EAL domain-containing protein [Nevskiaceae bacterium]
MAVSVNLDSLAGTADFLRGKANRYAWFGLVVAIAALAIANGLAAYQGSGEINTASILAAQRGNPALWLLDVMPLLFLAWGQQIGMLMAYHAGAMLFDETRALRDQAQALEYQLERHAAAPALTDLPGQRSFAAKLTRTLLRRAGEGGHCAVLAIDTQRYHEIALARGEAAAREFIDQVAGRLRSALDEHCVLGHFGYDDFAVLVRHASDEAAVLAVARRVQLALDTPLTLQRQAMSLRSSVGIAIHPQHGDDADALIRHAETAKYAATAEGREFLIYDAALDDARSETPRLAAELHAALDHQGLVLDAVEQHPLREGAQPPRQRLQLCWPHPRRGPLEQAAFIDLPSRSSLVHALTLWQLQEACTTLLALRRDRHPQARLSLRLAAAAFTDLPLTRILLGLLRAHDLPAEALTLELRESALTRAPAAAPEQLLALRDAGLHLCLCGIGRPGAAPASLLHFSIDEARLAPELLSLAVQRPAARELLTSTIAQLKQLGATVTISGADTPALLALAQSSGADYVEGHALPVVPSSVPSPDSALAASPA